LNRDTYLICLVTSSISHNVRVFVLKFLLVEHNILDRKAATVYAFMQVVSCHNGKMIHARL
jgi:hypothetical protein